MNVHVKVFAVLRVGDYCFICSFKKKELAEFFSISQGNTFVKEINIEYDL